MNRFQVLFCALAVTTGGLAASITLAQTAPAPTDPLAANAALYYWRAFATLPDLDEKQKKVLLDAVDLKPMNDDLEKLVRMSEPALRELHRGASQPRCVVADRASDRGGRRGQRRNEPRAKSSVARSVISAVHPEHWLMVVL